MNRIYRATEGPADWRALLADPDRQWRAGHSAMAAAQAWEAGFPPEVSNLCGPDAELQMAIVEHKVPMPGKGYPSQCDVFALVHAGARSMAIAVEAKVAEPFGQTLEEWLGQTISANKTERLVTLANWLGISSPSKSLRYQLFHRSAAAIVEARRFNTDVAAMIVHSFSPDNAWSDDFGSFTEALGVGRVGPGGVAELTLPEGLPFRIGWASGDPRFLRDLSSGGA